MTSVETSGAKKPEVVGFIETLTALIGEDRFTAAGAAMADFAKAHPGLMFFVLEALPAKVSDHLLRKTGAASRFTTYTLRHPTWAMELRRVATAPEDFARQVEAIEAALRGSAVEPAA
ncbi:hypothetical protein [Aquabacter spiritensis]|uniref:Uncharacterized protein n=1 Tax=Aquabacter spiritensis TaxID=933073 RepID=A0A4R3M5N7_9HYPH|nr:hypothetical protein [Aquabacter spiritensis]TCT07569.1 hypothetical protein EDC64_10187 [Aquabacter spiritensis]